MSSVVAGGSSGDISLAAGSNSDDMVTTAVSARFDLAEQRIRVFRVFDELRRSGKLCDVVLVCEGKEFPVHKMVLVASSQYFYSMFLGDMTESKASTVELHDIDPQALSLIINFLYTCEITITKENVESLLAASNLLQLDLVISKCCDVLSSQLSPANCLQIWHIADLYSCDGLCASVKAYTQQHFAEVVKGTDFHLLPKEQVEKLISSDHLTVSSEEQVFEAAVSWVRHDADARQKHLSDLLQHVRLALLPMDYIVVRVREEPLVASDLSCSKLVMEAMSFHMLKEGGTATSSQQRASLAGMKLKARVPAGMEQVMIVFGGEDESAIHTMECYSFQEKIWYPAQEMPVFLSKASCVVHNNIVYLIGGYNGLRHLKTVITFDPTRGIFSYVENMHYVRSEVGAGILDNKIYAVGGYDGNNCLRSVEVFDPSTNKWRMTAPMLSGKAAAGVGVANGLLYVIGGYDRETIISSMECYNPSTDMWTVVPGVKVPRKHVGAAELSGQLYIVGGRYGDDSASLKAHCFDPKTNKLRLAKDMPCTFPSPIVLTMGGMLYVDGRIKFLCFNPQTDAWTELKGKAIYRHHSMAAIVERPLHMSA